MLDAARAEDMEADDEEDDEDDEDDEAIEELRAPWRVDATRNCDPRLLLAATTASSAHQRGAGTARVLKRAASGTAEASGKNKRPASSAAGSVAALASSLRFGGGANAHAAPDET